jgi:twinkle protein
VIERPLIDLLAEHGFPVLKSYAAGTRHRLTCPKCLGGTSREDRDCLSVQIDADGQGATWNCKRGNCGWKGGVHTREVRPQKAPRRDDPFAGTPQSPPWEMPQPDWFYAYWDRLHIGIATLKQFGIHAGRHWFQKFREERDCIIYPYVWKRKTVGFKYRAFPDKDFMQSKGMPQVLYNVDAIRPGRGLHIVEGENDLLALFEAGIHNVISLKDGNAAFQALETHADALKGVAWFNLAGDADAAGDIWREGLIERLGRHRCKITLWPEGRKDASDVLRMLPRDGSPWEHLTIEHAVAQAKPVPIDGIEGFDAAELRLLFEHKPLPVLRLGVPAIDSKMGFPCDGALIVLTGIPSFGKTTFMRFVVVRSIQRDKRKWLIFSAETRRDHYMADCAAVLLDKPFYEVEPVDAEAVAVGLAQHMQFIRVERQHASPTVTKMLEFATYAVMRDGITDFLVDPWNELEHERGGATETDYIGRCLQQFSAFAEEYRCNVWIVAHPAKPPPMRAGESRAEPDGYAISGSAHWTNKCDLGLTMHRLKREQAGELSPARLVIWKSRQERWGSTGRRIKLDYHPATRTYHDPLIAEPEEEPEPQPAAAWVD